jgi:glycosyltransferase involved in cell wall biosynthesis
VSHARYSISVALATYNGARFVGSQLQSIAKQTRLPEEIVVGDDQSTDGTLDIVTAFAAGSGLTVRALINSQRLGSRRNFEQILLRCTGDIVVFSDQDDVWREDKLEKIEAAFFANPNAVYAFSDGLLIDPLGQVMKGSLWNSALFWDDERHLYKAGRGFEVLLRHNVVTGAAMAVRRSAATAALPIPDGWIHDYWLAWALEVVSPGIMINEPLISYRIHPAQEMGLYRFSIRKIFKTIRTHDVSYCMTVAAGLEGLIGQFRSMGAARKSIEAVETKVRFCQRRAAMRRHPWQAPLTILGSWLSGDYRRFTPAFRLFLPAIVLDTAASLLALCVPSKRHGQDAKNTTV